MKGQIGMPNKSKALSKKLDNMIVSLPHIKKRKMLSTSQKRYARIVVQRVIKKEVTKDDESLFNKKTVCTSDEIKVSSFFFIKC